MESFQCHDRSGLRELPNGHQLVRVCSQAVIGDYESQKLDLRFEQKRVPWLDRESDLAKPLEEFPQRTQVFRDRLGCQQDVIQVGVYVMVLILT